MTLLALDVGFAKTGWVVIKNKNPIAFGIIKTEKTKNKLTRTSDDIAYRASVIAKGLRDVILKYDVKGAVGELPSGGSKSAIAMRAMGMATAIASSVCVIMGIPVEWTTARDGKLAVCGKKNASKEEVMSAVRKFYPHVDWPKTKAGFEDVADAMGAYLSAADGTLVRLIGQRES